MSMTMMKMMMMLKMMTMTMVRMMMPRTDVRGPISRSCNIAAAAAYRTNTLLLLNSAAAGSAAALLALVLHAKPLSNKCATAEQHLLSQKFSLCK